MEKDWRWHGQIRNEGNDLGTSRESCTGLVCSIAYE